MFQSQDEQDAAARMLGLPVGEESRKRIRDLGISNDSLNPVRHIVRPSDEVSAKLSTSADSCEATEADEDDGVWS